MKPIATIGALVTIAVALFVVSKLTAPTSAVQQPAVEATKPAVEDKKPEADEAAKPAEGAEGAEKPAEAKKEDPADVNYQQNPFDLKGPGPYPKAVVDQLRFEFGSMPLGSTRSHVFVVKNEGKAPLKLEKGPLQCKCTMPALKDKEIPAGGQAEIVLEWKPLAVQAGFEKEAVIWTNDPENARLGLQIEGDVVSDDFWEPTESFHADQLKQGEERTFTGYVLSRTRDDLKIEKVDQLHNKVKVEYQPADEATLKEKNAKCGFVFKVTIPSSEEIALIRETITVTVNSATNTHIIWQVVGSRVGPISIIGNGWYAEKQLVQLGHFRAAEGSEKKFSMFLLDRGDKALEITDVKVDGPIEVSLTKDEKWAGKANDRYFLTVRYRAGGAPGAKLAENPLPVTITTNHPRIPTISFNVSYDAD